MRSAHRVRPPLVRSRDLGALVLDGDAAEGVVLALREALPVVRHHDPRQGRVTVEDDAEEVVRLALVPVVGRIDGDQRRDVRVAVGGADLQADQPVVGDRAQVVDGVQLAALVVRVVDAADAGAELEAQGGVVAQGAGDAEQVLAFDVEGDLVTVDDRLLDRVLGSEALFLQGALELVGDLVEPAAVGAARRAREPDRADQAAVAGGVAAVVGAEHAALDADLLAALAALAGEVGGAEVLLGVHPVRPPPGGAVRVAHRSSPFISIVGRALSAASSASRAASSAFTPSLEVWIFWWSLRMASISISGRGGQPGR